MFDLVVVVLYFGYTVWQRDDVLGYGTMLVELSVVPLLAGQTLIFLEGLILAGTHLDIRGKSKFQKKSRSG